MAGRGLRGVGPTWVVPGRGTTKAATRQGGTPVTDGGASPGPSTALLQVLRAAGDRERGLTFPEYRAALEGLEVELHVEVPEDD